MAHFLSFTSLPNLLRFDRYTIKNRLFTNDKSCISSTTIAVAVADAVVAFAVAVVAVVALR